MDEIEVKLPINKSNSLKALLTSAIEVEVKKEAMRLFRERTSDILSRYNLKSNKKRIKKHLDKFEELLSSPDLC